MAANENRARAIISGNGDFLQHSLQALCSTPPLSTADTNYKVIAIIGPQRSGKSTLVNEMYGTSFETSPDDVVQRTTQGIWAAAVPNTDKPLMVLDVEGIDSTDRESDQKNFENKSALFVLVSADIILINILYTDVGRDTASGLSLLKTIFEARKDVVQEESRKVMLMFVVRNYSGRPSWTSIESVMRTNVEKIWNDMPWGDRGRDKPRFDQIFQMDFFSLPDLYYAEEKFKEEAIELREKLIAWHNPQNLVLPIKHFPDWAKEIWNDVTSNGRLNMPPVEVVLAMYYCEEKAKDALHKWKTSPLWDAFTKQLRKENMASSCGSQAFGFLLKFCDKYDDDTYDRPAGVREQKRSKILSEGKDLIKEALDSQIPFIVLGEAIIEKIKQVSKTDRLSDSDAREACLDEEEGMQIFKKYQSLIRNTISEILFRVVDGREYSRTDMEDLGYQMDCRLNAIKNECRDEMENLVNHQMEEASKRKGLIKGLYIAGAGAIGLATGGLGFLFGAAALAAEGAAVVGASLVGAGIGVGAGAIGGTVKVEREENRD